MTNRLALLPLVTMLSVTLGACSMIPDAIAPHHDSRASYRPVVDRSADRQPAWQTDRASQRTVGQTISQSTRVAPIIADQCNAKLGESQARFTPLPDKYYGAGCATVGSVELTGLQGDAAQFSVSNLGPVACPLAEKLAGWARFGVDRAARQVLGASLVRIETMGSYACRNVAGSSRRSAHATAEAIDVSGFVLSDGRRVVIKEDWDGGSADEQKFLRIVQDSACKRFGIVLGPRYNVAHADHFHLEVSGNAYCR